MSQLWISECLQGNTVASRLIYRNKDNPHSSVPMFPLGFHHSSTAIHYYSDSPNEDNEKALYDVSKDDIIINRNAFSTLFFCHLPSLLFFSSPVLLSECKKGKET
jgi:hypothetical protein